MTVGMLTADWFLLDRELYFRKFEVYTMGWQQEVNMENVTAVAAAYGGPIAVCRNKQKLLKVKGSGQFVITVYSGSGNHITSIKWDGRPLIKMGWSIDEHLICVQEDGNVMVHDIFTNYVHTFSIDVQNAKVIDAIIFRNPQDFTGVAVMTSNFKIYYVNNAFKQQTKQLSDLPRSPLQPTTWAVISEDQRTEVLIARERELFRLKQDEHHASSMLEADISNPYTSIVEMAVSINARHLALFTDSGYLWLGSSDLRTKYAEVETGMFTRPKQLVWCGTEAVVAFWEQDYTLLVVGRHGEKMTYSYDASVALAPEVDGVRVLSTMQHELLQKVPEVVQKIFRINSTDPGSFLLEASKQYQKRSHRADEYIALVKNDLCKAVEQCIEAAGYEFDTDVQKMLIRAAQFGKCFVTNIDSNGYVKMCRLLRVLNAIRESRIGMPLTFTELQCLTHQAMLDRLVSRRHYYLAIQIAKYLRLPAKDGSNRILVHWAKYKVSKRGAIDDHTIAREIGAKLSNNSGISYSEIAQTASNNGHTALAIKLLDYEPKASAQVDLLVKLNQHESALVKAIESGDTDLVYDVIIKLQSDMQLADFKLLIRRYPVSMALYIKFCRKHDSQALMLKQEDNFGSQAQQFLLTSLEEKQTFERENCLSSAMQAYKEGRNELNASLCEEALRLLKHQKSFEEKLGRDFVGKSIHDTCKILLQMNDIKQAEKFKTEYKIPDKRYWWLRIQTLTEQDKWDELDKFSKIKKSPIGYAPFVDACIAKRRFGETEKYLFRVSEELKVKYYVKANKLDEAARIAFDQRDIQGLKYVQSKCEKQGELSELINSFITQISARK